MKRGDSIEYRTLTGKTAVGIIAAINKYGDWITMEDGLGVEPGRVLTVNGVRVERKVLTSKEYIKKWEDEPGD